MAISTNQFKNGNHIEVDGTIFKIMEFQHVKPGKGGAFVRTKLRRASDGNVIDRTFRYDPASGWLTGVISCRLTQTRNVMFIVTTHGALQCRTDWLGRPRTVIHRSPPTVPQLLQTRHGRREVRYAGTVVWVKPSTDPLMGWLAYTAT